MPDDLMDELLRMNTNQNPDVRPGRGAIDTALAALKNSLGTPDTPAGIASTQWRPTYGHGPELREQVSEPPFSLKQLISDLLHKPRETQPVKSGVYHDLIEKLNREHPDAMNRTQTITLQSLPKDVLGEIYGRSGVRVDPRQAGQQSDFALEDILRHEIAHNVGYMDMDRGQPTQNPTSAQDVDQASSALRRYNVNPPRR